MIFLTELPIRTKDNYIWFKILKQKKASDAEAF